MPQLQRTGNVLVLVIRGKHKFTRRRLQRTNHDEKEHKENLDSDQHQTKNCTTTKHPQRGNQNMRRRAIEEG